MTSVCTGSLVFPDAGLLDSRPATTHWAVSWDRVSVTRNGTRRLPRQGYKQGKGAEEDACGRECRDHPGQALYGRRQLDHTLRLPIGRPPPQLVEVVADAKRGSLGKGVVPVISCSSLMSRSWR